MTKLRNFFNPVSNDNRLFTAEEVGAMSPREFAANEKAIDYQMENVGVPRNSDLAGNSDVVYVHEYTRSDGTKVKAHYRSKHGGTLTGAAANKSMTKDEQMINSMSKVVSPFFTISGANLQNAMQDFSYAKNNKHAHILNSRIEITNPGLSKLMDEVGIPKNSQGIIYDANSIESKQIWNSTEIQFYIKNNYKNLMNNKKNNTADIEFLASNNLDNYLGIQHCKLYNPHITNDGHFDGIIVDYYDFNYRNGSGLSNYINNWGYFMQEKGYLKNQFNIYHIHEKL